MIAVLASWVPGAFCTRTRGKNNLARVSLAQDMGTQPKYREQQSSEVFADGRADRPHVPGQSPAGRVQEDDHYYRGYTLSTANGKTTATFSQGFPKEVKVDMKLVERGQKRFNIYCAACHGLDGYGKGMIEIAFEGIRDGLLAEVAARARCASAASTVTSLTRSPTASATCLPIRSQIPVEDRWAIVAYVRALQLSQNVPAAGCR